MFKSIFRKQFFTYVGILAVSFLFLAIVLSQALSSYFTAAKQNMLIGQGRKIADIYVQTQQNGFMDPLSLNQMYSEIQNLHRYMDASFILTDKNLTVAAVSSDISSDVIGRAIDDERLKPVADGQIVTVVGRMGNIFSEQVLTVAYPIQYNNQVNAVIFMNSSMPDLQQSIFEVDRIVLISMGVSAVVGFVMIYFLSQSITRPLRQMNEAAKIISSGDFEKRIPVLSSDEVGQLALSLNQMAGSLDAQEKIRREFISNISHDLRSPLTSMVGFVRAMVDGTIPAERYAHYLGIVLDESERLAKLSNDILEINSLQPTRGELVLTVFDVNELVRNTLLKFEHRVTDKNVAMDISFAAEKLLVQADSGKIERVIYNLLDNAVKFTSSVEGRQGRIRVETWERDGRAYVAVSDNGAGISEADQKRVFERFYKADASRGLDKTGSGLGLAIVREFVKQHGENVWLTSKAGEGTTIGFALPLPIKEKR